MRIALIAAFVLATVGFSPVAFAGNCDHSWERAADGSRCGGRAADQRDGGSDGW
jgi:hypothetical protein